MRERDYQDQLQCCQPSQCLSTSFCGNRARDVTWANMDSNCPVSETKQSYQRKISQQRQRFVKPKADVSAMTHPGTVGRIVVRTASVLTRQPKRSVPGSGYKRPPCVTITTTEALLSPRYAAEDAELVNRSAFTQSFPAPADGFSSHHHRKRSAPLHAPTDQWQHIENLNACNNKVNNFTAKNSLNRRLFNTSEEFILSITSNIDTTHLDYSQSTDTLYPEHTSPDPPTHDNDIHAQSTDALYFPNPHPPTRSIPIPQSSCTAPAPYLSNSVDTISGPNLPLYPGFCYYSNYETLWTPCENSASFDHINKLVLPPAGGTPLKTSLGAFHAKSVGDVSVACPAGATACYFSPLKPVKGNRRGFHSLL